LANSKNWANFPIKNDKFYHNPGSTSHTKLKFGSKALVMGFSVIHNKLHNHTTNSRAIHLKSHPALSKNYNYKILNSTCLIYIKNCMAEPFQKMNILLLVCKTQAATITYTHTTEAVQMSTIKVSTSLPNR
jgi:hypothetical protein